MADPQPGADGENDRTIPATMTARIVTVVIGVLLIGFIVVLFTRDDGEGTAGSPLLDHVVPPLVGTTLDGDVVDIDDSRGQWVLLNFFASWCIPCAEEHSELVEFSRRHGDGSATLISVTMGDTEDDARRFFDERGGDWPVIIDAASAPAAFAVLQVPETFLIAPSGVVVGKWNGQITADGADELIRRLEAQL